MQLLGACLCLYLKPVYNVHLANIATKTGSQRVLAHAHLERTAQNTAWTF